MSEPSTREILVDQVPAGPKLTTLQVVTLFLSLFVLLSLLYEVTMQPSREVKEFLWQVDHVVCGVFLLDWIVEFRRASNKWRFMRWGWLDLLSALPLSLLTNGGWAHVGRLSRLARLLRIIRAFRSARTLLRYVVHHRQMTGMAAVISVTFILIVFGSVGIVELEGHGDGNIATIEDGFWWAVVTLTTVGYGDRFPVTSAGRVLGGVIMIAGLGLFGVLTAFIGSLFINVSAPTKQDESEAPTSRPPSPETEAILTELKALREQVSRLETAVEQKASAKSFASDG
jgi:voltage-gated potassium channel